MITTTDRDIIRTILQRGGALALAMPDELTVPDDTHAWAVAQVEAKRARKATEGQR